MKALVVAVLVFVTTLLPFTTGSASAAPNRSGAPAAGSATNTCGNITCTTYWTRSYTKNVLAPAASGGSTAFVGLMAAICGAAGPGPALLCGGAATTLAGVSTAAITQAAAQNQCAAYVADMILQVGIFRTDNSSFCKD
ncbi:MAG: hypothetical protein ACT4RN_01605 [Pseudonocardia sp.]